MIIARLQREREKARRRAEACDRALAALDGAPKAAKKKSHIGPKGLKRIKEAQKARWQKFHKQQAALAKGKER